MSGEKEVHQLVSRERLVERMKFYGYRLFAEALQEESPGMGRRMTVTFVWEPFGDFARGRPPRATILQARCLGCKERLVRFTRDRSRVICGGEGHENAIKGDEGFLLETLWEGVAPDTPEGWMDLHSRIRREDVDMYEWRPL